MATEFSREFFADNRIVKASLRCAHKLREKDLDRIKSEIKKLYDATEVILNITVDESLLSGYVLQVGDRVFDNSGRHQLDKMMEGKPSLATLKTRIEDYKPAETSAEGGVVISSADGIVHIDGMNRAVYGEIVTFENGAKGMVESVEPEQLGVMLFDGAETVGVGTMVTRSGKRAGIPVGDAGHALLEVDKIGGDALRGQTPLEPCTRLTSHKAQRRIPAAQLGQHTGHVDALAAQHAVLAFGAVHLAHFQRRVQPHDVVDGRVECHGIDHSAASFTRVNCLYFGFGQ